MQPQPPEESRGQGSGEQPLQSWKEIAAYLDRDVRTAIRWEKEAGLPIRRHRKDRRSSVYAYPSELDGWRLSQKPSNDSAPKAPSSHNPLLSFAFSVILVLAALSTGSGQLVDRASAATGDEILARQIPASNGMGWGGSPSPDGERLYVVNDNLTDAGSLDLSTGEVHWFRWNTAENLKGVQSVVPSPDGTMLAYGGSVADGDSGKYEIRIADADGSNTRTVSEARGKVIGWTPDQQNVFIQWGTRSATEVNRFLGVVDVDTGDLRQILQTTGVLGNGFIPSLNGQWIAYAAMEPGNTKKDVYVVSADGGEPVLVSGGPADEYPLAATVDGNTLLIASDRAGQSAIWAIQIENGAPTGDLKLVHPSLPGSRPLGMTRSGTLLLSKSTRQLEVFEIEIDSETGQARSPRRVEYATRVGKTPTYLPDGNSVVYIDNHKLFVRKLDTGQESSVEATCGYLAGIYGVHPNGRQVMVSCSQSLQVDETFGYYLVDIETGQAQPLVTNRGREQNPLAPVLSADGNRLYFIERGPEGRIYKSVDVNTLEERDEWTDVPGLYLYGFSPDGSKMLIRRRWDENSENAVLELVDFDGTAAPPIPPEEETESWIGQNPTWSGNGKWIFFTVWKDGLDEVERMPADGGPAETLYEGDTFVLYRFPVHPSGDRFFVTDAKSGMETWALDNIGNVKLE